MLEINSELLLDEAKTDSLGIPAIISNWQQLQAYAVLSMLDSTLGSRAIDL